MSNDQYIGLYYRLMVHYIIDDIRLTFILYSVNIMN